MSLWFAENLGLKIGSEVGTEYINLRVNREYKTGIFEDLVWDGNTERRKGLWTRRNIIV